jgi:hypothetical protein
VPFVRPLTVIVPDPAWLMVPVMPPGVEVVRVNPVHELGEAAQAAKGDKRVAARVDADVQLPDAMVAERLQVDGQVGGRAAPELRVWPDVEHEGRAKLGVERGLGLGVGAVGHDPGEHGDA